jgi:hypothetical protein
VAASLKSPVTSISPVKLSSPAEFSSPVESFPTTGVLGITSSLVHFPNGTLTRQKGAASLEQQITPIFSSETLLLRISLIREILLRDKPVRKFLPTYGIMRTTFRLRDFPQWNRQIYGDRKLIANCHSEDKDNSDSPAEPLFKTCKLRLQKLPFPNGVYPLLFQDNSNLPDLVSKLHFQNFDST